MAFQTCVGVSAQQKHSQTLCLFEIEFHLLWTCESYVSGRSTHVHPRSTDVHTGSTHVHPWSTHVHPGSTHVQLPTTGKVELSATGQVQLPYTRKVKLSRTRKVQLSGTRKVLEAVFGARDVELFGRWQVLETDAQLHVFQSDKKVELVQDDSTLT